MMGIPSCGMLISAVHEEEGEERLKLIHKAIANEFAPDGLRLSFVPLST